MNGANGHTNGATSGFLSFNSNPPRVYVTAEDDEFDEQTIRYWKDEGKFPGLWVYSSVSRRLLGYDVTYFPMGEGGKAYTQLVRSIPTNLSGYILNI
jgi:hypothetical protein